MHLSLQDHDYCASMQGLPKSLQALLPSSSVVLSAVVGMKTFAHDHNYCISASRPSDGSGTLLSETSDEFKVGTRIHLIFSVCGSGFVLWKDTILGKPSIQNMSRS